MAIRKLHSNNVTENRADIATQYTELFFDDVTNSILLPDPTGLLELKIGGTTSTTATSTSPAVGGAVNPFAPPVANAPKGYIATVVDAGVAVVLEDLMIQMSTAGSRSLQIRTSQTTILSCMCTGSAPYGNNQAANTSDVTVNVNNTAWQNIFGWSFPKSGGSGLVNIHDRTQNRFWRITFMVGPGFTKNFISIERML